MPNLLKFIPYCSVKILLRQCLIVFCLIGVFSSCHYKVNQPGALGYSSQRRLVIVGDGASEELANYYKRRYQAMVWATPREGMIVSTMGNVAKAFGPNYSMTALMNELMSINDTVGRWQIIVPKIAEKYFLSTLSHIKTGRISRARGLVILIDSKKHADIEKQVTRVFGANFFVTYEFQKDQ